MTSCLHYSVSVVQGLVVKGIHDYVLAAIHDVTSLGAVTIDKDAKANEMNCKNGNQASVGATLERQ
jgi:hypothetical protein